MAEEWTAGRALRFSVGEAPWVRPGSPTRWLVRVMDEAGVPRTDAPIRLSGGIGGEVFATVEATTDAEGFALLEIEDLPRDAAGRPLGSAAVWTEMLRPDGKIVSTETVP